METRRIAAAIDNILDTEIGWKNREFELYKVLENKVKKYQNKSRTYQVSKIDKQDILANIKEQQWFDSCRVKSVIGTMIKTMDVIENVHQQDSSQIRLDLRLGFNGVHFVINYLKTQKLIKYFVYFENPEKQKRGYICYLDTTDKNKILNLPDYESINSVLSGDMCRMNQVDIIHLAAELLIYYDETGQISKAHIGVKYPVSLTYLASVINQQ